MVKRKNIFDRRFTWVERKQINLPILFACSDKIKDTLFILVYTECSRQSFKPSIYLAIHPPKIVFVTKTMNVNCQNSFFVLCKIYPLANRSDQVGSNGQCKHSMASIVIKGYGTKMQSKTRTLKWPLDWYTIV